MLESLKNSAVKTILKAIATPYECSIQQWVLKGGRLMYEKYKSNRFTTDIDFSTNQKLSTETTKEITSVLNQLLLDETLQPESEFKKCSVESIKEKPSPKRGDGTPRIRTFPALKIKIKCEPHANIPKFYIDIDCSYNEFTGDHDEFLIDDKPIKCYSFGLLMAEKFRAIFQQEKRHRYRCQDVYDLHFLIKNYAKKTKEEYRDVHLKLIQCTRDKNLSEYLNENGLSLGTLKENSKKAYPNIKIEIGKENMPDFDEMWEVVNEYFKKLPWDEGYLVP